MIHNLEYIKDYYRWRDEILKPVTKRHWKAKSHVRYLNISKASVRKLVRKLRKNNYDFWGLYN